MDKKMKKRLMACILAFSIMFTGCGNKQRKQLITDDLPTTIVNTLKTKGIAKYIFEDNLYDDIQDINIYEEADICLLFCNIVSEIEKENINYNNLRSDFNYLINNVNFKTECIRTNSENIYSDINELYNCDNFSNDLLKKLEIKLNNWLLDYGYTICKEYSISILDYMLQYLNLSDNYYIADENSLEPVNPYNAFENYSNLFLVIDDMRYSINRSDILRCIVTMTYEDIISTNSKKRDIYNEARINYINKVFRDTSKLLLSYVDINDDEIIITPSESYESIFEKPIEYFDSKEPILNNCTHRGYYYYDYVVRSHDSLEIIAKRFNTTVEYLMSINELENDYLKTRMVLKVPYFDYLLYQEMQEKNYIQKYTVKSNDTANDICNKYKCSLQELKLLNPQISNFNYLFVDEEINLPSKINLEVAKDIDETITIDSNENTSLENDNYSLTPSELYKKSLNELGYVRGVDVSSNQGEINWHMMYQNYGICFAILRAYSIPNGIWTEDKLFEENFKNCAQEGIPIGIYTFFNLNNEETVIEQTNELINRIHYLEDKYNTSLNMPIYIDYEEKDHVSNPERSGILISKSLEMLEKNGFYVGIYGSFYDISELVKKCSSIKNYDTWLARYKTEDSYAASGKKTQHLNENIIPTYDGSMYEETSYIQQNYDNVTVTSPLDNVTITFDIDFAYVDYPTIINKLRSNPTPNNTKVIKK